MRRELGPPGARSAARGRTPRPRGIAVLLEQGGSANPTRKTSTSGVRRVAGPGGSGAGVVVATRRLPLAPERPRHRPSSKPVASSCAGEHTRSATAPWRGGAAHHDLAGGVRAAPLRLPRPTTSASRRPRPARLRNADGDHALRYRAPFRDYPVPLLPGDDPVAAWAVGTANRIFT